MKKEKMETVPRKFRENRKNSKNEGKMVKIERCSKPHRLVVTDKKTNLQFLVALDAQVSVFPISLIPENLWEIEPSKVLVNSSGSIIHTFGQIRQKLDFGLGEDFEWKFRLVSFERPIIGTDFLSHFSLKIDFDKMCLINPKTKLETNSISTVACECHRNETYNDGWPLETAIIKRSVKHRFHVNDINTKMPFLVGSASQISVFPKSEIRGETIDSFNSLFEIVDFFGTAIQVQGWTTRKLNFGTGREFTWTFAVIDFEKPIIGLDFLEKFDLITQYKMGYSGLFDTVTKISTPAPTGPCECGNHKDGWPSTSMLMKRPVTKNQKNSFANSKSSSYNSNQISKESKQIDKSIKESEEGFVPKDRKRGGKNKNDLKLDIQIEHRLHITERHTELLFLVDIETEVSVFPKSELKEKIIEPFDGSFKLVGAFGDVLQVLGWITQKLDFGLGRELIWKFAVIDIGKPIIGMDFISYYKFSVESNGLTDSETLLSTPPPSRPCNCGQLMDGWPVSCSKIKRIILDTNNESKKPLPEEDFKYSELKDQEPKQELTKQIQELRTGRKKITSEEDSQVFKNELQSQELEVKDDSPKFEQESLTPNSDDQESNIAIDDFGTWRRKSNSSKDSGISNTNSPNAENENGVKHRFHITDNYSKLQFLISSPAELSVFPKSMLKKEDIEPFDGSFDLLGDFGQSIRVLGWTTQKLDFGLGREFTWKFVVVDIGNPIIGWDFISYHGLSFHTDGIYDAETWMTAPPPSGPCDCGKPNDGWTNMSFLRIKEIQSKLDQEFPTMKIDSEEALAKSEEPKVQSKSFYGEEFKKSVEDLEEIQPKEKQQEESGESDKNFQKPEIKSDIKHRFHVIDKNSKLLFLVNTETQVSVFPKSEVTEEDIDPFDDTFELIGDLGEVVKILGWIKINLDFNIEKEFAWKFAVIDIGKPIIGSDFISHYGFLIHSRCLVDSETLISTPPPSEPCDCSQPYDGWPFSTLRIKRFSNTSKLEVKTKKQEYGYGEKKSTPPDESKSKISKSEIKRFDSKSDMKHRFHVIDKNSNLLFLIGTSSEMSIFPNSKVRKEEIEPFDGSFELVGACGEALQVLGWTLQKLDVGLGREFTWKFAVINIGKPIIGWDFISYYGLAFHTEGIFDPHTRMTAPPPTEPCDCGKPNDGWPFSTCLRIREISNKVEENSENANIKEDTNEDLERPEEDFKMSEKESKTSERKKKHRSKKNYLKLNEKECFHITDNNTKLTFLINTESEISVFPVSEMGEHTMENIEDFFEVIDSDGSSLQIQGWTSRKLDFGLGREFMWKFAVVDINKPIICYSFLSYFNFRVDFNKHAIINQESSRSTTLLLEPCDYYATDERLKTSPALMIKRIPQSPELKEIKHCFHVTDKNSQTLFFVDETAQVSVFPRSQVQGRPMEIADGSELVDCTNLVYPIHGWIELKIDFGLEREFQWKFAVVNVVKPIIAQDFLRQYSLECNYSMKYPRLFDSITTMSTSAFTGSCNCGIFYNAWPSLSFLRLESNSELQTAGKKLEMIERRCDLRASRSRCLEEKRLILIDKITEMPYLLSGTSISVFPKTGVTEEEIEAFDDSFNLINAFGSKIPVYGWITRKLDFGSGRYFVWKFALIDIKRPMIANDFFHHYDFTLDFSDKKVIDHTTSKVIFCSSEFCECQARKYWPDIPTFVIKPTKIINAFDDITNSKLEETHTYLPKEDDFDSKKHNFHIRDKKSETLFVIATGAQTSIFPKSKMEGCPLETFNNNVESLNCGSIIAIDGWTTRRVDFGLGREFTWKFAVLDVGTPILGSDFLKHYGFTVQNELKYLSMQDNVTIKSTSPSKGLCDCGNSEDGCPGMMLLPRSPTFTNKRRSRRGKKKRKPNFL